ncbi:hypothetical protein [Rhodospirillum sp. A1_3_36]|uniref:hypothetical protein n=1 Tax=Rhodospirillum sp. A1_3_36 TaxID=3391666 RepID=UPI0039A5848A
MTMPQSGLHTHPDATTEDSGVIELATEAEAVAGTDDERAVTPESMQAWGTSKIALHRATLSSNHTVQGGTQIVMPFSVLNTEIGSASDVSLNSSGEMVFARSGLYQLRYGTSVSGVHGGIYLEMKAHAADNTLLRNRGVTSGLADSSENLQPQFVDFLWMPTGGRITCEVAFHGNGGAVCSMARTELSVMRIAD